MAQNDIEELREHIRQMDFERGTHEQIAHWREDVAESRANLVIEDMTPTIADDAMFAMMLDAGVPPALMPSIILSPSIGRASWRERMCRYVYISAVAVSLNKKPRGSGR